VATSNRYSSSGDWTYGYDDEGSLTSKANSVTNELWKYTYDHRNRLTQVEKLVNMVSEQTITYQYDVLDRRISKELKTENGTLKTRFAYNGEDAWLDVNPAGQTTKYLFSDGIDQNQARYTTARGVEFYLKDRMGSVTGIQSSNGSLVATATYSAYGIRTATSGSNLLDRYAFTGRELETETGDYYYRSRFYSPTVGRFLSEDKVRFRGGDSNLFRFNSNSPNIYIDPSGKMAVEVKTTNINHGAIIGLSLLTLQITVQFSDSIFSLVIYPSDYTSCISAYALTSVALVGAEAVVYGFAISTIMSENWSPAYKATAIAFLGVISTSNIVTILDKSHEFSSRNCYGLPQ
jgi:RHS repeat-associated protein